MSRRQGISAFVLSILAVVLLAFPTALHALTALVQADSGGSGSGSGTINLDPAAAFLAIKALLIPTLAAWAFKKWNIAKGALDGIPNLLKSVAFVVIALIAGLVATAAGQAVGADPNSWTESTVASLLGGIVGTLQVHFGIATAKAKKP